jgi:hypothetical protein
MIFIDFKPLFWAAFFVSSEVARLQPDEKHEISAIMTSFAQCLMKIKRFTT